MTEATDKETLMIKNRFARMYPNNKPLSDSEAVTVVRALKEGRQWYRVLREENFPR